MLVKDIRAIEPVPSRCIEVDSDDRLFASGGNDGKSFVSHNSVAQRNIILGTILRPDHWRFLGVDLKRVELSAFRAYSNVVLGIATTLEDALTVLRFGQETMMKRYTMMEELGVNNFLDLPEKGQALMIMVDEAGELLSPSGVKALSEHTPIPTPNGMTTMGELQVGDTIYDNHCQPTTVTVKYEPADQSRFDMTITDETSGISENIVSGSEHNWCAYFTHPDGTITGPQKVTAQYLYEFAENQKKFPENERVKVKFKRSGTLQQD